MEINLDRQTVTMHRSTLFALTGEKRITLQIPSIIVDVRLLPAELQAQMNIQDEPAPEEFPLCWFLFLTSKDSKPFNPWENRRKGYFLYWSQLGFQQNQPLLRQSFEQSGNQRGTWELFLQFADFFYRQVERKRNNQSWQHRLNPTTNRP